MTEAAVVPKLATKAVAPVAPVEPAAPVGPVVKKYTSLVGSPMQDPGTRVWVTTQGVDLPETAWLALQVSAGKLSAK